jgi:hypothetical protein
VTPELILFGIKALIRVGQQADKALVEYGANAEAAFPDAITFKLQDEQTALTELLRLPGYTALQGKDPFDRVWVSNRVDPLRWTNNLNDGDRKKAFDLAAATAASDVNGLAILVLDGAQRAPEKNEHRIGLAVVNQFEGPTNILKPLSRVVLVIAEVALEYVAVDPSILGVKGARGERILKAFANALAQPLSDQLDAAKLGIASQFFDDMVKALVGAAFDALKVNVGELISDKKLAALVGNALEPVVVAVKTGDLPFQRRMQAVFDALLGPAAMAAMKAVADDPAAFFGSDFDKSKAAGALVSALLVEAAKNGDLRTVFSDQKGILSERGLIAMLTAVLDVASKQPELFIHNTADERAQLLGDVIKAIAGTIQAEVAQLPTTKKIDPRALAGKVAAAAIAAAANNADAVVGHLGADWHEAAAKLTKKMLADLATALNDPHQGEALKRLFSEDQLAELARIVIEGIAANPAIFGVNDADMRAVISAVATAAAADTKRLLKPEEWLELAKVMVKEIAAHPRIVAGSDKRLQVLVEALGKVITAAPKGTLTPVDVTAMARILLTELVGSPVLFERVKPEVTVLVQAVAKAIELDKHQLLSGADWLAIFQVAAAEAAANPARLFGLNYNDANQALAADVIGLVLKSIPAALPSTGGLVLKPETLREATIILLRYLSSAPDKTKKYLPLLTSAVKEATEFVGANPGAYGSKELLRFIRVLSANILAGKYDAELAQLIAGQPVKLLPTPQAADALLAAGGV